MIILSSPITHFACAVLDLVAGRGAPGFLTINHVINNPSRTLFDFHINSMAGLRTTGRHGGLDFHFYVAHPLQCVKAQ